MVRIEAPAIIKGTIASQEPKTSASTISAPSADHGLDQDAAITARGRRLQHRHTGHDDRDAATVVVAATAWTAGSAAA